MTAEFVTLEDLLRVALLVRDALDRRVDQRVRRSGVERPQWIASTFAGFVGNHVECVGQRVGRRAARTRPGPARTAARRPGCLDTNWTVLTCGTAAQLLAGPARRRPRSRSSSCRRRRSRGCGRCWRRRWWPATIGMNTPSTSIVTSTVASAAKLGAALRRIARIASRRKNPQALIGTCYDRRVGSTRADGSRACRWANSRVVSSRAYRPVASSRTIRPARQLEHAAAHLVDHRLVVGGHQHGRAGPVDPVEQPHDVDARLGIEVAGRLVGQQQRRMVDERARDRDALLLAAGELVGVVVELRREARSAAGCPAPCRGSRGACRRSPGARRRRCRTRCGSAAA